MRLGLKGKRLAAMGLAGAVLCSMALSGCRQYVSSQELKAQAEAAGGRAASAEEAPDNGSASAEGAEAPDSGAASEKGSIGGDPSAAKGSGGPDMNAGQQENGTQGSQASGTPGAGKTQVELMMTKAAMPEFEETNDTVYVKTSGGSVRVRSSCNTEDDSNILTYASGGTSYKRTGKSAKWTRIDYNGTAAYISSDYVTDQASEAQSSALTASVDSGKVTLDPSWKYAEFSKINSGAAVLYRSSATERKNITICVNAGHGTKGGSSVKTLCHPDGTPKVTGGTTGAGATTAVAVSGGMTFADGTAESKVTLAMAKVLKDKLLAAGYDVLMIRESDDVQLDNVARTVIANNSSDCHISLHWDSTSNNKGAFYMSVPDVASYRNMEPVKSHWQQHNALGESLVAGLRGVGVKIFSGGSMAMDLTQTSFSTVPSMDIELGDKASDHSQATLSSLADGLVNGVNQYFGSIS